MSKDKVQVTFIRYSVDEQFLLQYVNPLRFDVELSLRKYELVCTRELKRLYPKAEIEIVRNPAVGVPPAPTDTIVFFAEEGEDEQEADNVNVTCERIAKDDKRWLVAVDSVLVSEVTTYEQNLHASFIRWACVGGAIQGAYQEDGLWRVPYNALQEFVDNFNENGRVTTKFGYTIALVWENMDDVKLSWFQSGCECVIVTRSGFGPDFLSPKYSYVRVIFVQSSAQVIVEQFVDVERWPKHTWTYEIYCEHLMKQAKRLTIRCDSHNTQRNGATLSNSISFHFEEKFAPTSLVKDVIQSALDRLADLLDSAEISLAGGPILSPIHKRKEDPFRKDILDPLLRQMGFRGVQYTHGPFREHGRDFVLEYETRFHETIYVAVQAKCGNVSGNAHAVIDNLVHQINYAFLIPYIKDEPGKPVAEVYISCLIVATSGHYTNDAVTKIRALLSSQHYIRGNVFFWDENRIKSLIDHYWGRNSQ